MILTLIFLSVCIVAAALAALMSSIRGAVLSLWVLGISMGCLYVSLHAEMLAVIQWIVSTVVAISFIFYSMMFGEWNGASEVIKEPEALTRKTRVYMVLSTLIGAAFAAAIYFASTARSINTQNKQAPAADNIVALGKLSADGHFMSIETLGLTLFIVLVGSGILARPVERPEKSEEEPEGELDS